MKDADVADGLWQWEQHQSPKSLYLSNRGTAIIEIAANGRKGDDAMLSAAEIHALCKNAKSITAYA